MSRGLLVEHVSKSFGEKKAVDDLNFAMAEPGVFGLIGTNGAGKTTILHALSGLLPKREGSVMFDGEDITAAPAHRLVGKGLAQVPEGRRIFGELTVYENLVMGGYILRDRTLFSEKLDEMYGYFPILKERAGQIAGTLSGGEQQMLAMSRALMTSPKLLLLDEPGMGLSPLYVHIVFDMIRKVNEAGTTVLLVEQNAKKALAVSDRAYVLETGSVVKTGTGADLLCDEDIRRAYLGS